MAATVPFLCGERANHNTDGSVAGGPVDRDPAAGRSEVATVEQVSDVWCPRVCVGVRVRKGAGFAPAIWRAEQRSQVPLRGYEVHCLEERSLSAVVVTDEQVHTADVIDRVVPKAAVAGHSEACQHSSEVRLGWRAISSGWRVSVVVAAMAWVAGSGRGEGCEQRLYYQSGLGVLSRGPRVIRKTCAAGSGNGAATMPRPWPV